MIFATFGNAPSDFSRLAAELDRIASELSEPLFVQAGHTKYNFQNVQWADFLTTDEMQRHLNDASIIITHGGWGTISESLKMNKKIVAVPRRAGLEHNHPQGELVSALEKCGCLLGVYDVDCLLETLEKARTFDFQPLERGESVSVINDYLNTTFPRGG